MVPDFGLCQKNDNRMSDAPNGYAVSLGSNNSLPGTTRRCVQFTTQHRCSTIAMSEWSETEANHCGPRLLKQSNVSSCLVRMMQLHYH